MCVCKKCAHKVEECHVHQQVHNLCRKCIQDLAHNAQKVFVTVIIILENYSMSAMISRQNFNNHGLEKVKSSQLKVKKKHFRKEVLGCGCSVMRGIPSKCLNPELLCNCKNLEVKPS